MASNLLRPSSRNEEADWIGDRLAPFGSGVTAIVPGGFEAYVRIFHPATGLNDEPIRWADVAAKSGRTMHRLAQFHAINRPELSDVDPNVNGPNNGNLPLDLLKVLYGTLAAHTSTPQSCFFCLWEGYDWRDTSGGGITFTPIGYSGPPAPPFEHRNPIPEFIRRAVAAEPRVRLPGRDYLLFEGPLEGRVEVGSNLTPAYFMDQSPNLFWPEDHAWCAASEIDLYCTLVAGSKALAESLTANSALEACLMLPDDPISSDSDTINV